MADPVPTPSPQNVDPELTSISTLIPNGTTATSTDVEMTDSQPIKTEPTPQAAPVTPVAAPTPTPTRNSPHPSSGPQQAPTHANPHGSPTRVYLNQNVTPHLLEAMKHLATNEPEKPLKWLSEFLAQKSVEIEG
ncbi:hypothetical protein K458DRAFT_405779 [Lentithecium fluviatile CBS 122367]|uniref:Dpy-30 domain-containing protein n=1 Tax=Lentithecium fluviatile CBS 122367 TaxID=1168545 RepID=A0A6G1IXB7_9PLEO|nr:hypothetical protein K458DRAFT_405779 [Lentithecium fluviatile CBS 122367]